MKKTIYLFLSISCMFLCSCLENNAGTETRCFGTAVDKTSGQPAMHVKVIATDGIHYGNSTQTASDGSFSINVSASQLNDGYYLIFTADSLYKSSTAPLSGIGFGLSEYNLGTIQLEGPELPLLTTDAVNGITMTSAICGGEVSYDGRSAVFHRGICWNTASNPTIVNNHIDAGTGIGHFSVSIDNLTLGQTYFVRAYATNRIGTAYGQEVQFTASDGKPVVTTGTIIDVSNNSIICGGTVLSDNGTVVTARGICYSSTSSLPTLNDPTPTTDGTGTGDFTSHITGLLSSTTYYLRAYATNAYGTSYGEVKTATTN